MTGEHVYRNASLLRQPAVGESPAVYYSDAFRLLKIHQGSRDSDIKANILVRKLRNAANKDFDEAERYEALSYTWGPQDDEQYIEILDHFNIYKMKIGPNLDSAIRHLRRENEPLYLWVDALCINQKDKHEKGVQIPLMREIYSHAECVRVWLGPKADDSDMAMEFVIKCLDMNLFDKLVKDAVASSQWAALSALMRRRWFSRRWIIQEIALAKIAFVHCGDKWIEWTDFASVLNMLSEAQSKLRRLFRESVLYKNHPDFLGDLSELGAIRLAEIAESMFNRMDDRTITSKAYSLESLMSTLTAFEPSEPHDILYAILWLANDAHPVPRAVYTAMPQNLEVPTVDEAPSESSGGASPRSELPSPVSTHFEVRPPGFAHPGTSDTGRTTNGRHARAQSNLSLDDVQQPNGVPRMTLNPPSPYSSNSNTGGEPVEMMEPIGPDVQLQPLSRLSSGLSEMDSEQVPAGPSSVPLHNRNRSKSKRPVQSMREVSGVGKARLALQWLQYGTDRGRIVVDYDKTILEVYQDFVELALGQSKSLNILCIPWASPDASLPSWVPQLSRKPFGQTHDGIHRRINADPLVRLPGEGGGSSTRLYNASKHYPANCKFGEDGFSLHVSGFVLDRIRHREKPATDGTIPAEWMQAAGWVDPSQTPPVKFWRTLVGNLDRQGTKIAPVSWAHSCVNAFKQRPTDGPLNTSTVLLDCPSNVRKYLERVQCVVWSRRLVLLEKLSKHSIALAPSKAKKGDLICILYGCSVPVVLRRYINGVPEAKAFKCVEQGCPSHCRRDFPLQQDVVHYEMIGECYVHGMMGGEAFYHQRRNKQGRLLDEVFQLR